MNVLFVPGILAIIWGRRERHQNKKARTGFVCGIIGTAVALLGTVALVAAVIGASHIFSNRLLRADFRNGPGPFNTGSSQDYDYDVVDGVYRIVSRTGTGDASTSFAWFPRTAYAVDISADIASVTGDESFFGVGCLGNPDEGYLLLASPRGGVALSKRDSRSGSDNHIQVLATNEQAVVPARNVRLMLRCRTSLAGSSDTLTGYVNGTDVIHAKDSNGLNGFQAGGLAFQSSTPGAELRVNRADADVSGTGSSGSRTTG